MLENGWLIGPLLERASEIVISTWFHHYLESKNEGCVKPNKIKYKKCRNAVDARWNSMFLMLKSAVEAREAFERLANLDCDYK